MRNQLHWILLSRAACDPAERRLTDDIERRLRAMNIAFDHEDESAALTPDAPSPVLLVEDGRLNGWGEISPFLSRTPAPATPAGPQPAVILMKS